jgi:hypothetical protein
MRKISRKCLALRALPTLREAGNQALLNLFNHSVLCTLGHYSMLSSSDTSLFQA